MSMLIFKLDNITHLKRGPHNAMPKFRICYMEYFKS